MFSGPPLNRRICGSRLGSRSWRWPGFGLTRIWRRLSDRELQNAFIVRAGARPRDGPGNATRAWGIETLLLVVVVAVSRAGTLVLACWQRNVCNCKYFCFKFLHVFSMISECLLDQFSKMTQIRDLLCC